MKSIEAKIVVLGSQGVGKTSIVVRYVANQYNKHVNPTIGASFFTCKMTMDNYRVKMQVWDTAGQERFRSMAPMYYRKANAALIVYDISSEGSFDEMKLWVSELQRNIDSPIVYCIIGNKSDLEDAREVSVEKAQEYASSIGASHYFTSALSNQGVQDVFCHVTEELIHLAETPNGGIQVMDNYSSPTKAHNVSLHSHSNSINNNSYKSNNDRQNGGCCS